MKRTNPFLLITLSLLFSSISFAQNQLGQSVYGDNFNNFLGHSVAISNDGQRYIAGAYGNDSTDLDAGLVRVYSYNSSSKLWEPLGADILGDAKFDRFGDNVTISGDGNVIAIGAYFNDSIASAGTDNGQVKIFEYDAGSGQWSQRGESLYGAGPYNRFGISVSLSNDGEELAIGATGFKQPDISNVAGQVTVYKYNTGSNKYQLMGVQLNSDSLFNGIGSDVALSSDGQTVAIGAAGAQGEDPDFQGSSAGRVRVFSFNSSTNQWIKVGDDIIGDEKDEISGESIDISGDSKTIIVGGRGFDNLSGRARIFRLDEASSKWEQMGQDILGYGSQSMTGSSVSVSLDGNTIAVGAMRLGRTQGYAGDARIFNYNSNAATWDLVGMPISGEKASDEAGTSLSISGDGNIVVVGSPRNDGKAFQSGQVRVFSTGEVANVLDVYTTDVFIYPNPSTDFIHINGISNGQLALVNSLGQKVFNADFNGNSIDISEVPRGIYFAQILSSQGLTVKSLYIK